MADQPAQYELHLATDLVETLDLDVPITTDRIDYYESGLWVHTDGGRDFYPYDHVLTIHERPAGEESAPAASEPVQGPVTDDE